jgi:dolichol-phosphate mannosyltransferase
VAITVYVCLPAYNEENSLKPLFDKYITLLDNSSYHYKLLLVNDGSTDKTLVIAQSYQSKLPLEILTHNPNRGLGEAIRTGFHYVVSIAQENDAIIYMDSDDTHDPVYIPSMVKKIEEGFDVVIASRYQPGSEERGVPFSRRLLSRTAGMIFRLFLPVKKVKDYTCGYRAYRVGLIRDAIKKYDNHFISAKGFACTDEILIKLSQLTNKMTEVPFILYYDRKKGKSKLNLWKTIPATLHLLWTRGKD